jgi:hypothetical protein
MATEKKIDIFEKRCFNCLILIKTFSFSAAGTAYPAQPGGFAVAPGAPTASYAQRPGYDPAQAAYQATPATYASEY